MSNFIVDFTIVCMLQRDWSVYEKGCHPLFSINVLIGYFSSNWPALSSRAVKCESKSFFRDYAPYGAEIR